MSPGPLRWHVWVDQPAADRQPWTSGADRVAEAEARLRAARWVREVVLPAAALDEPDGASNPAPARSQTVPALTARPSPRPEDPSWVINQWRTNRTPG